MIMSKLDFCETKWITFLGESENCIDICRLVISEMSVCHTVLVIDSSRNFDLFRNVFVMEPDEAPAHIWYSNVCYTYDLPYVEKNYLHFDFVFVYAGDNIAVCKRLNNKGEYFFSLGVGRLSQYQCCKMAQMLKKEGISCCLIYRKRNEDAASEVIKHIISVKKVFCCPKNEQDYMVLERVDYGYYENSFVSNSVKKITNYIASRSIKEVFC